MSGQIEGPRAFVQNQRKLPPKNFLTCKIPLVNGSCSAGLVLGVKSGVSFLQQVAALVCTRMHPNPNMQGTFLMKFAIAKDVTEEMPEGPFDIILSRYAVAKLNKLPQIP